MNGFGHSSEKNGDDFVENGKGERGEIDKVGKSLCLIPTLGGEKKRYPGNLYNEALEEPRP